MLAKMEDLAPLHVAAPFSFEFREPERSPDPLLVLEDVAAGYPDKTVLSERERFPCAPASGSACSASTAPASPR